ncbi:DUF2510 domain-containing protein [Streptomyces sp. NPDC056835]|uniref:DUF2510 domain-containing protein n=1 Tax=Streptomyces sp. NPDC056835 TaxID=3345956 RepID=UPI0036759BF1
MTYTTPPGWHPDPGHTGEGPRQERWWDGSAWTDEVRAAPPAEWDPPAAVPPPAVPPPATPPPVTPSSVTHAPATSSDDQPSPVSPFSIPPYPATPPPGTRRGGRRIAIGAIAAVVAVAIAGGFYLLGRDSGGDNEASRPDSGPSVAPSRPGQQSPAPDLPRGGGPGGGESGAPQQQPQTEDGYATDAASGISIPVPDGWTGESGTIGAGVTTGKYECPGDTSQSCVRGGVFSAPAAALKVDATTAKAAAEKDIEANAEESYGGTIYGDISSHQQLKSEEVTVAGQKGYLVRWKVVTSKGDDGYVQSIAFSSPTSPELMVLVRSGFDVNDKAPKLTVMDEITKGIKAAAGTGSGGSGQGV